MSTTTVVPRPDTARSASSQRHLWTTLAWVVDVATLPAMIVALYMAFIKAPDEQVMHSVYRLFYFHVPAAVAAFLGFSLVFVCSILYVRTRKPLYDRVAVAAAETGVIFCTLGILLGMIWAKPVWNTFWIPGDVHLMSTAVLWLVYVSYLMLRGAIDDPERRARLSAVMGIISIVLVPVVFFSIRVIHQGNHPVLASGLPTSMAIPFMVNMMLMMLFYVFVLLRRVRLENHRSALQDLRDQVLDLVADDQPIGEPTAISSESFLPRRQDFGELVQQ